MTPKSIHGEEVWHGSEHDGSTELPGAYRSWFAWWRWGAFTTTGSAGSVKVPRVAQEERGLLVRLGVATGLVPVQSG
ncbi:hypothetical protein ACVW0A_004853 [Pseudomonas sp. TE3610]